MKHCVEAERPEAAGFAQINMAYLVFILELTGEFPAERGFFPGNKGVMAKA